MSGMKEIWLRRGRIEPAASETRGGLKPAGSPGAVDAACLRGGSLMTGDFAAVVIDYDYA